MTVLFRKSFRLKWQLGNQSSPQMAPNSPRLPHGTTEVLASEGASGQAFPVLAQCTAQCYVHDGCLSPGRRSTVKPTRETDSSGDEGKP